MAKFIVCTDSGCDLSLEYCRSRGIVPVPMSYSIDGVEKSDTMDPADLKIFYDKMRNGAMTKTSQVTPFSFAEFWTPLLKEGLPILHISLGSGISGTWASAVQAAEYIIAEQPEAKIRVIDSTLASVGYGMLAIMAADMRDKGCGIDECAQKLEDVKGRINTYYTTGDLTYLYRSGRVSKTGAAVAKALNIWPILRLDLEGHLLVDAKERGKKHTLERLHSIIREKCIEPENQTLYICHSDITEEAEAFGAELKELFGFREVFYTYIGTTIGANCGPGLVAAFFIGKERTM